MMMKTTLVNITFTDDASLQDVQTNPATDHMWMWYSRGPKCKLPLLNKEACKAKSGSSKRKDVGRA